MNDSEENKIFSTFEKRSILGLSGILFFRMFSIFLLLPVFSILAFDMLVWDQQFSIQEKFSLIGIAYGVYGLTQCFLQIPFGMLSDRFGRKKIIIMGLILFIFGNILAAVSESIYLMIFARIIQGTGAISSTVFALIADLTRQEVRTRANAAIGISIGIAFALAFALASFLGEWIGLDGIFWLITFLSVISLILLLKFVPSPEKTFYHSKKHSFWEMLKFVWEVSSLRAVCCGGFVCGVGLSSTFFYVPIIFSQHGIKTAEMWKVYLPMLILGGVSMVLASVLADVKNYFREVMLSGIVLMLLSLGFMAIGKQHGILIMYVVALYLFFMGFNVFEPILPSLVSRNISEDSRGTAIGVYNFSQFFGHFVGATIVGILFLEYFFIFLFLLSLLEVLFFYLTFSLPNPIKR